MNFPKIHLSWEKALLMSIHVGIFFVVLTPLIFTDKTFFPTLAPQTIYFRILVEFLFGFYLLLLLESRAWLPRGSPLLISLGIFLAILALTSFLGIHPGKSFWGTFNRMEGLIAFIHYGLFFIILTGVLKQTNDWLRLLRFVLFVSVPIGIIGFLEYFSFTDFLTAQDGTRMDATLGNPSLYGGYLLFLIFIGILLTFKEQKNAWKIYAWVLTIFNGIFLLFSGTRSAWLALVLGIGFLFFSRLLLFREHSGRSFRSILIGLAVLLAIILVALLAWQLQVLPQNTSWDRYLLLWQEGNPLENSRLILWSLALEAWQKAPLFGYGLESFTRLYDTYYDPSFARAIPEFEFYDRAHNVFLEFLIASGLLGLLAYLAVFASAGRMLQKSWRRIRATTSLILASLLLAYLTHSMFVFDITPTYLLLLLVLAFIHVYATSDRTPQSAVPASDANLPTPFSRICARAIFFVGILSLAALGAFAANRGFVLANVSLAKGLIIPMTASVFENLSEACTYGAPSLRLRACAKSTQQILDDPFRYAYTAEAKQTREAHLKRNMEQFRKDLTEHQAMAEISFYSLLAQTQKSLYLETLNTEYLTQEEQTLKEAIRLNPSFPRIYRLYGEVRIFQNRRKEGEEYFEKAYELDQNRFAFHQWFGEALVLAGHDKEGAEELRKSLYTTDELQNYGLRLAIIKRIIGIYGALGDKEALDSFTKEATRLYPFEKTPVE